MSNRIAAFRPADRVELDVRSERRARRPGWRLGVPAAAFARALSPHLRRDLGLADAVPAHDAALDVETRRLGF